MHCFCAVEQCGIMEQMSEFSAENGATCLDDYCGKNLKEAYLYCIHMVIMMIESDNRATYQKKASSFFFSSRSQRQRPQYDIRSSVNITDACFKPQLIL